MKALIGGAERKRLRKAFPGLAVLLVLSVTACAPQPARNTQSYPQQPTRPQPQQQPPQQMPALSAWEAAEDAVASYKRSKPELLKPGGEFGVISDMEVALTLTPALEWAQARQQCDQKPSIANLARRPNPQQVQRTPPQPPCRGTPQQVENCERAREVRERRNQPPAPDVRYSQDCYTTAGPSELRGKLVLKAVPENSAPAHYAQIGAVIGTVDLKTPGQTAAIKMPVSIATDQCFVLTDSSGVPIKVRSGTTDDYAFANTQLVEEKTRTYWAAHIKDLSERITNQNNAVKNIQAELVRERAWKSNQCVKPAMRPVPPQPRGLTWEAAELQSKGYCLEKLGSSLNGALVIDYIKAAEEFEYIEGYRALTKNREACTRKAYEYDPNEIQAMRLLSWINPRENERRQVIALLNQCARTVHQSCAAHLIAWKQEVDRIQEEPDWLFKSCSDKVVDFAVQGKRLEQMGASRKEFQDALAKFPIGASRKSDKVFTLTDAKCEARK